MTIDIKNISSPQDIKTYSEEELQNLAASVREFLLDTISKTGGHIGANLGVVELSIAIHYCFNSPRDTFLFDTGHQGYTHKLLTGRAHLFPSLNSFGGMNRFITPTESEHDPVEASHAGTSISVGLAMALANRLSKKDDYVVVTIGDSALAEGVAFEALNHACVEDVKLILVVNDNGFAISPGFGALHEAFQSQDGKAQRFFEAMGANYIGPVNGHAIGELNKALKQAKQGQGVSVVHAKTIKGFGWEPANDNPFRMHFSFPFDPKTGASKMPAPPLTYPDVAASVVDEYMQQQPQSVCVTPSTLYATGLSKVFEKYPDRCFDPGMEEQHALSMCVGFALKGVTPIIAYQSTFIQRAFDQLIHDIAFANRPCLILSFRSGFSGYDNPTHHGVYDISFLQGIPNFSVFYPKDRWEAEHMVREALKNLQGPTMILMPYGPVEEIDSDVLNTSLDVFLPEKVTETEDMMLVTVGNKYRAAEKAVKDLRKKSINAGLINIRKLKPLPTDQLLDQLGDCSRVVVIEEAVKAGGLGSQIALALMENNKHDKELLSIALPTEFIRSGSNSELEEIYELDATGIVKRIQSRWP